MKSKRRRVLICPLNWGLGHATRLVPVVRELVAQGFEPVLAGSEAALAVLRGEFPGLESVAFGSYRVRYSRGGSQVWAMLRSLPRIVAGIVAEHYYLKKLVRQYDIDAVVSDNRFGLWHKGVLSVYFTHQIMVKMPPRLKFLEKWGYRLHKKLIERYDACLVPDFRGEDNLSGDLAHQYPLPSNAHFVGILSRFAPRQAAESLRAKKHDLLVLLSGPEPQRSIFEEKIFQELAHTSRRVLVVRGKPGTQQRPVFPARAGLKIVNHLPGAALRKAILEAGVVVCRAGYSSIMDLVRLQKTAILVPTPGQTEQEYLAAFLHSKKMFFSMSQSNFCLRKAEKALLKMNLPKEKKQENSLKRQIKLIFAK